MQYSAESGTLNFSLELGVVGNESDQRNDSLLVNTSNGGEDIVVYIPDIKQPVHMIAMYSIAYSIVFLLGLTGNLMVVLVVYRNVRMHNVTNYFIVNLAVADMLVCIVCLPITLLSNLYSGWRFGAVMCKVTPFLQGVAVSASVSTLTAISLDRYLAICYTLEYRMTRKVARFIILSIWLAACALMAPWLVYYQQVDYSTKLQHLFMCHEEWPSLDLQRGFFLGAIFLTCYTIPLVLISVCYTLIACRVWHRNAPGIANASQLIYRSKIKVVKMLVVVVILFAFSWLPLYATHVRILFGPPLESTTSEFKLISQIVVPISQWLGSSNSCVNPIIYCFFSHKFRHGFHQMVRCCKDPDHRRYYFNRNNSATYHTVRNGSSKDTACTSSKPNRNHGQRLRFEDVSFV